MYKHANEKQFDNTKHPVCFMVYNTSLLRICNSFGCTGRKMEYSEISQRPRLTGPPWMVVWTRGRQSKLIHMDLDVYLAVEYESHKSAFSCCTKSVGSIRARDSEMLTSSGRRVPLLSF